ncbi:MAG: hypothetical protein WAN86_28200, partial [Hyphomicrobiaceae bacterium]
MTDTFRKRRGRIARCGRLLALLLVPGIALALALSPPSGAQAPAASEDAKSQEAKPPNATAPDAKAVDATPPDAKAPD